MTAQYACNKLLRCRGPAIVIDTRASCVVREAVVVEINLSTSFFQY
jgi:hypothetical protein